MELQDFKQSDMLWMFGNFGEKSTFTLGFVLERMNLSYCGLGRVYLNVMAENGISVL